MADLEGVKVAKNYHLDAPFANQEGFYVKGANALDWGMKKHMSNIFDAKSGNTVMFAFDHILWVPQQDWRDWILSFQSSSLILMC